MKQCQKCRTGDWWCPCLAKRSKAMPVEKYFAMVRRLLKGIEALKVTP